MYRIAPPAAPLARFIENYWYVEATENGPVDLRVSVFVDGRADLIANFGAPYSREVIGGEARTIRRPNLDAQRLEPIRIAQRGNVRTAGVRFRIGGLAPFVAVPLRGVTGTTPALSDVFDGDTEELLRRLDRSRGVDAVARCFDAYFLAALARARVPTSFYVALDAMVSSGGNATVEAVANSAGVSPRQVARLFSRYLGLTPKELARVTRFQTAMRALMRDRSASLVDVALEAGYFDQAHFIREFRRMTGGVPRGYKGYYPEEGPDDFAPNVVVFLQDEP